MVVTGTLTVDGEISASRFSRASGLLGVDLKTPNGWLKGHASGRNDALVITENAPLSAELALTEPFRQRLLYRIHPVLADMSIAAEFLEPASAASGRAKVRSTTGLIAPRFSISAISRMSSLVPMYTP